MAGLAIGGLVGLQSPHFLLPPDDQVTARLQPEKRLMLAILEGAVVDLQRYATATSGRGRRLFLEAEAWFASTAADGVDFETICGALGFDPSFMRAGLRRWCIARRCERSPLEDRALLSLPSDVRDTPRRAVTLAQKGKTRRGPADIRIDL